MDHDSGLTSSPWRGGRHESGDSLQPEERIDVCVVGAGIAGLSVAHRLARAGKRVLVLEDGVPGSGETGRTTAHLASALDDRFHELERTHGEEGARLAAESHAAAIDEIERVTQTEGIACDFRRLDGYLVAASPDQVKDLDRELAAARRAGLVVERVERAPITAFETGPALKFARQGRFSPLHYLEGLVGGIRAAGGRVVTGAHAETIEDGRPARVAVRGRGVVRADAVVVATNSPVNERFRMQTKMAPYRTYAIAARIAPGTVADALYWDMLDPYHYVRLAEAGEAGPLLIVGGEDHKTGQEQDGAARFERLIAWTRERFPDAGEVTHRWSGQVLEPVDGLAFIGKNPGDDHVYVATGDSGHGMTHGTIAGLLIGDLILKGDHRWRSLYDPARKSGRTIGTFLKENVNVALQMADWVTPGEVGDPEEIPLGEGAIIRKGATKIAVHRTPDGGVHALEARCPHLGCVVAWNPTEKSWDCPCHGSRFDPLGHVVNGPANRDLERRSLD